MPSLIHQEAQQLTGLLRTLVDAIQLYNEQKPELNRSLITLLNVAAATFRDRGQPGKESHTASLQAELTTALRGINPVTLERPAVRRHEMQSAIAFKVLQSLESELRASLQQATESLHQAEALINQITLAGIQKGMISDSDIAEATTQEAIESLWRSLAGDADIGLAQKRVLLMVSVYDAYILTDKVLSKLRAP